MWALAGCAQPEQSVPPNIILISIDTLRADRLGAYGFPAETSPTLDRLAELGVRFDNAISQSSWTLPAHMSLFTSLRVSTHQVVNEQTALGETAETLASALSSAGYQTAGFASWVYLSPKFGFGRGFEKYVFIPGNARAVAQAALDWHSESATAPYFLFLHFFDPHTDLEPPAPYDTLFTADYSGPVDGTYDQIHPQILGANETVPPIDPTDRDHLDGLYQGEIRFVDDEIGRMLTEIDTRFALADSLVVVVSDHGEELGDHGSLEGHGWTLYEEILRVPMIWTFPDLSHRGMVVSQPVALIDVAPTILDAVGLPIPDRFQGRSLLGLLEPSGAKTKTPPVIADSAGRFGIYKRAVRGPRYKLIETQDTGLNELGFPIRAGYELYDLLEDPGEQVDLFDPEHPAALELLEVLDRLDAGSNEDVEGPTPEAVELSDEEKRLLESLGYIQ